MDKVRIIEIAQELGMEAKDVLAKAKEIDMPAKAANSTVSTEDAGNLMNYILTGVYDGPKKSEEEKPKAKKSTTTVKKTTEVKAESKTPTKKTVPKEETPVAKEEKATPKVVEEEKKPQAPKPQTQETKSPTPEKAKESSKTEEPKKETPVKKETLAQASLKKRRGLVIVKKKRAAQPESSTNVSSGRKKMLEMPQIVDGAQKKKKKIKKAASAKQDQSEKIDIFSNGDISSIEILGEEDMVVLHDFDFTDKNTFETEKTTKKKFDPTQMRATKQTSFTQQRGISRKSKKRKKRKEEPTSNEITHVEIPEEIRVYEFAEKLDRPISDIIKVLFTLGVMVTKNDFLDKDAIEILAEEFGIEVTTINPLDEFDYESDYEEGQNEGEIRPPVITIMGHVDHGKTSLLDKIRSTKVASGEHGGITQHIGAYMIEKDGQKITFIDTPGHAAFTEMRSRGAQATDIVVIVVAADDGVKPQTKEAIEHAKAADVPFVIAINKIDKPDANPDLAKSGLAELGVTPTDWGGEHEFINLSAHTGEGINDLLEVLLLQAEILELKAEKDTKAKATVIESSLQKGRGAVATVIMQNGTLKVGDTVVCGVAYGKVKLLLNEDGEKLKAILPGEPGVVVGLSEVPGAGESLVGVESDKIAREYANKRADYIRQKELSKSTKVTLEDLGAQIAEGNIKSLPIILKADVAGSLEAIKGSLDKLRNEEVKVNVISSGVGGVTESDITLAEASENCVILGFNVRPTGSVKEKAKKQGVSINTYNIIYDLIDDVKGLLGGLLSPVVREENLGQAEVREVFTVPKLGAIAGSIVTDGTINRGAKVRVIRNGVVIYEGEVSSLKRFKDDVREVAKGYECGIGVVGYNDVKPGDYLESFKEVEEQATLD
ncbi:MAG: translation initiation factor IF-2 [Epsilonproteobacteria bacterium]|nr:translation initiation factor IF-2 [Campylobacterota bacterium]